MNYTDNLVISDIHLGSESCNAEILLKTLKDYCYKKLIIAGDLFEEGVMTHQQFKVFEYLSENRDKIIYVDGNHDPEGKNLIHRLGINMVKKHQWDVNGKKFCAIHGHRFDKICFIFSEPLIDKIFWFLINLFRKSSNIKKWIDDFHNKFSLHFAKKVRKYAIKQGIDVIICGHTHIPSHQVFHDKKGRKIDYFNCGGWIGNLCTFITIDEEGNIELHSATP